MTEPARARYMRREGESLTAPATHCPCCRQRLPEKKFLVDPSSRTIISNARAVVLSIGEFSIFRMLHLRKSPPNIHEIITEVYRGTEAPLTADASIHTMIKNGNRKLEKLGLKMMPSSHGRGAWWQIVQEAEQ